MTGTGTQADPYIPTTLTEFITAVGTSGAYVALTQDINAADDPEYSGELMGNVYVRALQVEGAGFSVIGVTVRAEAMITFPVASSHIKNMAFRQWAHKKTSNSPSMVGYNSASYDNVFENCLFSLTIDAPQNFGNKFLNHIKMTLCAVDVVYTSTDGSPGYAIDYCTIAYTTLFVSGMWLGNATSNSVFHDTSFPRSAAIFSDCIVYDALYIANNMGLEYSYIALLDTPEGMTSITGSRLAASGAVIAIDDSTIPLSLPGVTRGTIAQMKDQDWLTSVGFLP